MARSLRAHLLRLLLPPIAALLAVGAVVAYYPSMEPATEAYDQALVDIGIALGAYVRISDGSYSFELPSAVEQVLRTDRYDTIYYRILSPGGADIAGEPELAPAGGAGPHDAVFRGQKVHVVSVHSPCGPATCTVLLAETTVKRSRLTCDLLFSTLLRPPVLAVAILVIVWFGVEGGLGAPERVSEEIKERSPRVLRPIVAGGAPEEARGLGAALFGLRG